MTKTSRQTDLSGRPGKVFVDSGAWIALAIDNDSHHPKAKREWANLLAARSRLYTSNYVLDESITRIRRIGGYRQAVRFGQTLLDSQVVERVYVDEELEKAAWDWFVRYGDQMLSFTDCTSFAVMKNYSIDAAFSFDADFSSAGFQCLP